MARTDRPCLVLAHYFGGSARSWMPLLAALGDDFPCIASSLPGFGGAPVLPSELSLDAYAAHLAGLAPRAPWIAAGHSMGGKIALATALRRPQDLVALILIATSPPAPESMTEADRGKTLASFGNREAAQRHIDKITNDSLTPDLFAACVEDELRVDRAAWRWWLEHGSRDDISSGTAALTLPVLVVGGSSDTVMGVNAAPGIAAGLCHAKIEVIADGGHLVPLEQPESVARVFRSFVTTLAMAA